MSQRERKTLVVARLESSYAEDSILANLGASPGPYQTDAILCGNFDVQTNADTLERQNYNPSLSSDASNVGRVLGQMTFTTEARASGVFGTPARIGRLFKACGMSETIIAENAAATIANPVGFSNNTSAHIATLIAGITKTTMPTSRFDRYRVTFTTGGIKGVAKYVVTGAGHPDGDAAVLPNLVHRAWTSSLTGTVVVTGTATAPVYTFAGTWAEYDMIEVFVGGLRFYYQCIAGDDATDIAAAIGALIAADTRLTATPAAGVITCGLEGTAGETTTAGTGTGAIDLGTSAGVITIPELPGAIVAGEGFEVLLRRPGVRYDPVSDNFSSLTIWAFLDGTLYRIRGARGTWSMAGQAAQYPTINWTFTGLYTDPVDAPLPANVQYEDSPVFKVELAELSLEGLSEELAKASRFSFDMANTVGPNDNINADEAFDFVDITARAPAAGADPETVLPSVFNPWSRMRRADTSRIGVTIGRKGGRGYQIRAQADRAGYTGAPLTARNGIRAYDFGFRLARVSGSGDDEVHLTFY